MWKQSFKGFFFSVFLFSPTTLTIFLKEKYSLSVIYRLYNTIIICIDNLFKLFIDEYKVHYMLFYLLIISFFKTERQERNCQSKAEGMLGSAGANPRLWALHKHDIWLLVRSVALIKSEHLRSEPQPDHNVLPRGDSAGGDINNKQSTQGSEREEFSVCQPVASPY